MNLGLKSVVVAISGVLLALLLNKVGFINTNSSSSTNTDDVSSTTTTTTSQPPGLDFGTGSMFDQIADRYDTINRVLALRMDIGWRREMTTRLKDLLVLEQRKDKEEGKGEEEGDDEGGWKILDVATGTADVALQLVDDLTTLSSSSETTKGVTVLGLDPSENMLAVGRNKIKQRQLQSQITLERADARDLSHYYIPVEKEKKDDVDGDGDDTDDDARTQKNQKNHYFDAATIAFGIRNVVPNRTQALCEIHKVLKPQGVLAILEFSQPTYATNGILGSLAGLFIQHIVPVVGGLLSGGARKEYLHLQHSIQEFPTPIDFQTQLQHLQCELQKDNNDFYFYTGYYEMEDVTQLNFGSVQLYIGRASIRPKQKILRNSSIPKLPPIPKVK